MYIISISHKTAPVKIRELFTFSKEEQETFIKLALHKGHIEECVIVSTCNRSEVYFNGDSLAIQAMQQYLAEFKNLYLPDLMKYFLIYCDEKANKHLFQVTCGMDSMVIGEDEILGQVKDAYEYALSLGATKYMLNTLFQAAITCAKKVKTETLISKTPVSIGTLVANEVLQFSKATKHVLIIGITGKMGSIIMKNLSKKQKVEIIGTSRSHNFIVQYGKDEPNVTMIDYRDRYLSMDKADVIISATTSPHYTITYQELASNISTEKERLFIDLSVPMDIDKEVLKLSKSILHDIDYFEKVSNNNTQIKAKETFRVQLMIEEHLDETQKEIYFHEFLDEIPKIREMFDTNTFENILYRMKVEAKSTELLTIFELYRRLIEAK